jgi:exodeoxyribonuclease VII large subunit
LQGGIVDRLSEAEYPFRLTMMAQLSLFQPVSWSVTDLTRYIRLLLDGDETLQDLWVQGEVSNFSKPASGHIYFTLKDNTASLRCVMWRTSAARQSFIPREGDAIEAHGNISVYEVSGMYQLYMDTIRPTGEGLLYQEFLRLKARLEAEGLFDTSRKREIPPWPHKIGIVTSPTGAALRDMLNILSRRYPLANVILAPTSVQGDEAPIGIVSAIQSLNRVVCPDLILLARGGGSIEDLWAFNDERVARAIVASQAPIITGIGHETDFTIADFAADLRAPTPTAAAELATPNRDDLLVNLADLIHRLTRVITTSQSNRILNLGAIKYRLNQFSPQTRIRTSRQQVDDVLHRLETSTTHRLILKHALLQGLEQKLAALNPLAVLGRGYAIVTQPDGRVIIRVNQVQTGDQLIIRVSDGGFNAVVNDQKMEEK